jgi:hypothetical protein
MAGRLRNRCCHGKAISSKYLECVLYFIITNYLECVFVALIIQHAMRMRHIVVICGLSGSTVFFRISVSHKRHDFPKRNTEHEMCDLVFSITFV